MFDKKIGIDVNIRLFYVANENNYKFLKGNRKQICFKYLQSTSRVQQNSSEPWLFERVQV